MKHRLRGIGAAVLAAVVIAGAAVAQTLILRQPMGPQNAGVADSEPDGFLFPDQTGVAPGTVVTSAPVLLGGFNQALTVTCAGCTAIGRNGTFTPGTSLGGFQAGDALALRLTSPGTFNASASATATAGGVTSPPWTVTTAPQDTAPDAIMFVNQTGAALGATITSNEVTLTGFTGTLAATCSGCTAIGRNGAFSPGTTLGGFTPNDRLSLQLTASPTPATAVTAAVTVGTTTSAPWGVTTEPADTTPNPFSFVAVTGVAVATPTDSAPATISGINQPVTASCTGCTHIARNGAFTAGTSLGGFVDGDTLQLRVTSSPSFNAAVSATATVGGVTSPPWTVTTAPQDTAPDAIMFANQTGVLLAAPIDSNAVTLTGFTGTLTATCTGCTAIARNGAFTAGTSLAGFAPNDTIQLRVMSSGNTSTAVTASVTVGTTVSASWSVTTGAQDTLPDPFSFTDQFWTASGTATSNAVTLTGFNGTLTATCTGCTEIGRNGAFTSGTSLSGFAPNDTIQLRLTAAPTINGTRTATVTVGSRTSGTWTVTTTECVAGSQTFTSVGTTSVTVPPGCDARLSVIGGGGSGAPSSPGYQVGGSGGGGGFARAVVRNFQGGNRTLQVTVGHGGAVSTSVMDNIAGSSGGVSSIGTSGFPAYVTANGGGGAPSGGAGSPGSGGAGFVDTATTLASGRLTFRGGNAGAGNGCGSCGQGGGSHPAGGGGGAAGPNGNGTKGTDGPSGGAGGAGGGGAAGAGGNGGNRNNGNPGRNYGGGGAGAHHQCSNSCNGASGWAMVEWAPPGTW